jgi:serine/threonine protein kinase
MAATKNGQEGAIKIFHPELVERYGKETQLERIKRELSLVGLHHPHLVKIIDGGECEKSGHLFVVMQQLPYKNLQQVLNLIPPKNYGKIISQIASAARFLEDLGLAHRDIKPENIAITNDFDDVILMDMGVLKPIGISNLTDVDQRSFIGTLRYSSPEFLDRKERDTTESWRAVTFYQIGAVLHDLIMQKPIFEADSEPFSALVDAVRHTNPLIVGGDGKLMLLARRALIKNPTNRLEMLTWNDFEEADKVQKDTSESLKNEILQRQKLSRATTASSDIGDAEKRRLFLQRMDQLCRRLDTRLASIITDLRCFPLRSSHSEGRPDDSREIMLHFTKDEILGMPFNFSVKFSIKYMDDNEGDPLFSLDYCDGLSARQIIGDELTPLRTIFKGIEEDMLSGTFLQSELMKSLNEYYTKVETGNVPTGVVVLLSNEKVA